MPDLILGGVILSPHMIWVDQFKYGPVAETAVRTLGGNLVMMSQELYSGRPITLVANETQGWLTKNQVTSIQQLANQAGATYQLQIDATIYDVSFRHDDSPAFIAEPLDQIGVFAPSGYYTATIKLRTV